MRILPIRQQDYRPAAQVLSRAFVDDPVSIAVYKNFSPAKRIHALECDFTAELRLCMRRGSPIQASENGHMVAVAVIYPPGCYPLPPLDQWMLLVKSILGNGWYDVRAWMRWLDEVDRQHPKLAHYYLEYVGVDPQYQGKGYGTGVIKYLSAQADTHGVGCYLENANPSNVPFYQRFGFQVVAEKRVIGLPTWFMWRPPTSV
jgi:GNAT superfamily N-acetyltransferase